MELKLDFCFAKAGQNKEKDCMANTRLSGNQTGIPEGYSAIPIQEADMEASVRLCVLAREIPDPSAGFGHISKSNLFASASE